ncbi:MAG: hypothetical protein Kow0062_14980 [Acidobacteriota bacterium]
MSTSSQIDLRETVGRAIRTLREEMHLSLDDIERVTDQIGVRVTRSHLSRVENGQADLAVPRFLGLMHALGQPPMPVLETIDAAIRHRGADPVDLDEQAADAFHEHAWDRAACAWRAAFATSRGRLPHGASLGAWVIAEASLGRWRQAMRVARLAVSRMAHADERVLLRAAATALGGGETGTAHAFARAAPDGGPWARLIELAALVAWKRPIEAAARLAREETSLPEGPARTAAMVLAAEAFRESGRHGAALRLAERATGRAEHEILRIEAQLAWARALVAVRRPGAGLRQVHRALRAARALRLADLVACAHELAEELHRLDRAPSRARDAGRARRALMRRHGADRCEPRLLPVHSLLRGDLVFGLAVPGEGDDEPDQCLELVDPRVAAVDPEPDRGHARA